MFQANIILVYRLVEIISRYKYSFYLYVQFSIILTYNWKNNLSRRRFASSIPIYGDVCSFQPSVSSTNKTDSHSLAYH
jgi:hypothetical protein